MHIFIRFILLSLIAMLSASAYAADANPITVNNAWVRATAPGQKVGAAYMTLTHNQNTTFVGAYTDIAGKVEIHSMEMKNNVMKMRMVDELPIVAGKPTTLAPSGLHLMLFDLKAPLKAGEKAALTLCFKDKNGVITHQTMTVPIKEFEY
jgi:copper(I)-binding protein